MFIEHPNQTRTYLETAGDPVNPALILLHGLGADHRMWEPQIQVFADAGFYILAPDLLAHGRSSKVEQLHLDDWNRQIVQVLDHLNLAACTPIGVSMGGVIAQHFAVGHPARVERLVLSDTFGELKTIQERLLGASQVLGFQIYKRLGAKLFAKGMASAYKAPFAVQARTYMEAMSAQADFDQLILARKAINQIDAIGAIDGAAIPTLCLVGQEFGDSFVRINQKIANAISGAEFNILLQSMDPSNLVNPPAFNQAVLTFLSQN